MAAGGSSAILKRLAALNRSGVLQKPVQYSQVKADLGGVSEEEALRVLNQLEVEAETVDDPVQYIRSNVAASAAPSAAAKRKMGAADGPPEAQGGGMVAKRVRLLNESGKLGQPIRLPDVTGALSSIGIGQAMAILKGLEDAAPGVRDPTAYIRTAVRSAGGVAVPPAAAAPMRVKQELGGPQVAKVELGARDFRGTKTEDLGDAERIERHIGWLNRNAQLRRPLDLEVVLPALDCIGYRQSIRVLKRLEESADSVADPNEFVKDLVARSGWIWAKPDIIDDDEKVAKRVSWLNQFGMLQQPIDYAQVADALDGLRVPHAMVLLRELEVQSHKIEHPTEYIKKSIGLAGEDEIQIPLPNDASVLAQHVATLNRDIQFAKPIEFSEVGKDLSRIGDEDALKLLQEVARKGKSIKDPTGFIKFKMKAKLAALGSTLDEASGEEAKILKRVEWLNDFGGLLQDIDYNRVGASLGAAGLEHAMTILRELEDKRSAVRDPNAFILNAVKAACRRQASARGAGAEPGAESSAKAPAAASADLKALASFTTFLQQDPRVKRPVKIGELATALDSLGSKRALQVLQQMQERGLGLDDPLTYIRAIAQRHAATRVKKEAEEYEEDDVAKITKRLKWLNQFAGLAKKIRIGEVVGALYCLGVPLTMDILRGLQEKGQSVSDPTWYIKAAVQRANGVPVTPAPTAPTDGEAEYDEFAEDHFEADEDDIEDAEAAAEGIVDFEEPEGEDELVDFDLGDEGGAMWEGELAAAEDEPAEPASGEQPDEFVDDWDADGPAPRVAVAKSAPAPAQRPSHAGPRRVVGSLSGATGKLVPVRPTKLIDTKQEEYNLLGSSDGPAKRATLPVSPQEKLVQVRDFAVGHGLHLDEPCLKALARLPFYRARDLIDETVLGGKDRRGVRNPSKYLMAGAQKIATGLGVEQGIAMELAVSLGVVLNNEALDELASIPRRQAHALIRELSMNADVRQAPLDFIRAEVLKCRAQVESRPWPPTG
mmetsp:Transcript_91123/g.262798  ORF Transcript_91123/g.262798 Transcript_91123/m.262798 type:complete len:999 (-) Transcript_91123:79-3075(-)